MINWCDTSTEQTRRIAASDTFVGAFYDIFSATSVSDIVLSLPVFLLAVVDWYCLSVSLQRGGLTGLATAPLHRVGVGTAAVFGNSCHTLQELSSMSSGTHNLHRQLVSSEEAKSKSRPLHIRSGSGTGTDGKKGLTGSPKVLFSPLFDLFWPGAQHDFIIK